MIHLTDEQLNEYLDNEITERAQIEAHLSSCEECAARLTALQALFAEIESLPELELTQSITERFTVGSSLPAPQLPGWLTLTATLQVAITVIAAIIFASPVMQLILPYLSNIQAPSFPEIFLQLQSLWMIWLDMLSQLQIPTLPEIPVIELSSLVIMLTLAGVSALWIVGNGLLLRNQIKNKTSR
jgi:Putative zinc-finger